MRNPQDQVEQYDRPEFYRPKVCPLCGEPDPHCDSEWERTDEGNAKPVYHYSCKGCLLASGACCTQATDNFDWDGSREQLEAEADKLRPQYIADRFEVLRYQVSYLADLLRASGAEFFWPPTETIEGEVGWLETVCEQRGLLPKEGNNDVR